MHDMHCTLQPLFSIRFPICNVQRAWSINGLDSWPLSGNWTRIEWCNPACDYYTIVLYCVVRTWITRVKCRSPLATCHFPAPIASGWRFLSWKILLQKRLSAAVYADIQNQFSNVRDSGLRLESGCWHNTIGPNKLNLITVATSDGIRTMGCQTASGYDDDDVYGCWFA